MNDSEACFIILFVFSSGNAAAAGSFFLILLFFLLCKCCFNDSEMEKELKRHIHGIFNEHLKMHHALLCAIYLIQERKKKCRERLKHARVDFSDDFECFCYQQFIKLITDVFLCLIHLSLICIKSRSFHS